MHLVIENGPLRLGFYTDDLLSSGQLNIKQWYHVAYVYERLTSNQSVYVNGNLDGTRTSGLYAANSSRFILGPLPSMLVPTYREGYIDQFIYVSRVKNATELLNEATLVAYYSFDGSYNDSGPNRINNITQLSTTFDSNGRFNQSLVINSTNLSYFQTSGFYYLGQSNYSYSFSLWINPSINNGTILQVSSSSGNWCVPMIGFNKNRYLTVQTSGSNGLYSSTWNSSLLPLNKWTYVCMTYSVISGIRLFVNGSLVNSSNSTYKAYQARGERCTITVGTCLQPNKCGVNRTQIIPSQFQGKIDELKIFARELSVNDISLLATSP